MAEEAPSVDRLRMGADALNAFLRQAFPDASPSSMAKVVDISPGRIRLEVTPGRGSLRPGGIVSGPTQMGLADTAAYALILAHIGPVAMAVTSSLSFQFLRGCRPGLITIDGTLLRLGRRSAVTDIRIWTDEESRPVGQASVTYMLP